MTTDRDMRGISQCSANLGWHAYMAGPCFDRYLQAVDYRDRLDAAGVKWWPQDEPLPRTTDVTETSVGVARDD